MSDLNVLEPDLKDKNKKKSKVPRLYKVILLNDDFTPMDFVITVLQKFFSKQEAEATKIMLNVHNKGSILLEFIPKILLRPKLNK